MVSENKKNLILLLTKYNSRKFIESTVALLDNEEEIEHILQFINKNSKVSKTDIHEEIINMKFSNK